MEKKVMSQKEYLKKYVSSVEVEKKKKKKKPKIGQKTVKIIDDDIDLEKIQPLEDHNIEIFLNDDDAPQIVGYVNERGPVEFSDKKRWKMLVDDNEGDIVFKSMDSVSKKAVKTASFHPVEFNEDSNASELTTHRQQNYSDNDLSPPRPSKKLKRNDDGPGPSVKSKHKRKRKHDYDSDISPPRNSENNLNSFQKKQKGYDSDLSPPRVDQNRSDDSDLAPPRKQERGYDSDLSPPRSQVKYDSDLSPLRKQNDLGPPRHTRHRESSRHSPSRQKRHEHSHKRSSTDRRDKHLDRSSRRHSTKNYKDRYNHEEKEYERRHGRNTGVTSRKDYRSKPNPDEDRRKNHRKDDERRNGHKKYNENGRNELESQRRHESVSESSRERRKPSRWNNEEEAEEPEEVVDRRMKKTLDGKTAGLQDARALKEETEAFKRREADLFNKLSKEVSGVGQATIVRDRKTGRKRDLAAEATEAREKQKRQDEIDEKYSKWGKGLKQVQDREDRMQDDIHEMNKPLARYADDADLDKHYRQQLLVGDPMLEYMKQKQIKEGKRKPDPLKYEGSYMPNRFGIKPGHRWDGVDRSNGYEKKWFDAKNAKVALQEEAYKWSTADM